MKINVTPENMIEVEADLKNANGNDVNRAILRRRGRALAKVIMFALEGEVSGPFGSHQQVMWDSVKKKSRLYRAGKYIPCDNLIENLTNHEIDELLNLPEWNGNNGYQISVKCFGLVDAAINRYRNSTSKRSPYNLPSEEIDITNELWECRCRNCREESIAAEEYAARELHDLIRYG